jgi:outer membrane protein OmpA-like peptidoglycan-associated protein
MSRTWFCSFLLATLLSACASPSYVVLLKDADGGTGKVELRGAKGTQVLARADEGADLDGAKPPYPVSAERLQEDFGAAMAARPLPAEHFQLYFDSGGAMLTADSAALLPRILDAASRRPAADISIIGHTDTVGSADKNAELARTRARTAADLLVAGGLKALAVSVESHGESNLLVKTPDETPEPRNRRVEITVR